MIEIGCQGRTLVAFHVNFQGPKLEVLRIDRDTRLSQHQISHLTLLNRSDVPHDHELVSILGNGKLDLVGILPLNGAQNLLNQHTRQTTETD
jgi:hypothetical protein